MSYYFKSSTESVDENHATVPAEAPVAGVDSTLAEILRSATIIALLEDYFRCGSEHGAFESFDAAMTEAKRICDEALNNGDITSGDFEHVVAWLNAHRFEFESTERHLEKFVKHVCGEEVAEIAKDKGCSCCQEFVRAAELKRQCAQMGADMNAKYGQIITGYAADFMRLYGKNFNEKFRAKFGM